MSIEFHAPRCPDCDEQMRWTSAEALLPACSWCEAYGKPEEGTSNADD